MIVNAIKTKKITANSDGIFELLDEFLPKLHERSVVVITSKIVALCEGQVVHTAGADKEELIKKEADFFLPASLSKYGYHFTITKNTLIAVAGIDESNSGGDFYVLWPKNPQESANKIRQYLSKKFNLDELGVIISDSTCTPMRRGTIGIPISYSGFKATHNYVGQPDLFGRPFKVSQSGTALGLSASAVLVMGEGTEQTPLAVVSDVPFVEFQDHDPTSEELEDFYIATYHDDLFAPFFDSVTWQKGGGHK